jgi:glycine/D-amino acid oxidase-like deaminating enzyme
VGGGLAGVTAALQLAQNGKGTVLLEAERSGFGASGRNGGFVSSGFAASFEQIAAKIGLEAAKELHALSAEGTEYVRTAVARLAPRAHMGDGWIVASRHPTGGALERRAINQREETGARSEYWSIERTRATLKTDRYFEAIFHPVAFLIDPLAYIRALVDAAAAAGVRVFEGTRARAWATTA